MARLGVPRAWRAVLLTSDVESLDAALAGMPVLESAKRVRIKVRGEWAQIVVVRSTVR